MKHESSPSLSPDQAAHALAGSAQTIVNAAVNQFYALRPDLQEKHGPQGVRKCTEDCHYHLDVLVSAVRNSTPKAFTEYMRWTHVMLSAYGGGTANEGLAQMIEIMGQHMRLIAGDAAWQHVQPVLDPAIVALRQDEPDHALYDMPPQSAIMVQYLNAALKGDRLNAQQIVMDAFHNGMTLRQIYLDVFQPALYEVGRRWELGQVSVAQEHLATAITQTILAAIYAEQPLDFHRGEHAIVACLPGNHHQIGPRMVADFLSMEGYNTLFLGANTPENSLLHMIQDTRPTVIGLPSTLNWHVDAIKTTIEQIRSDFNSYGPTIMVGGIAFNLIDGLWKQVGGDVWGRTAGEAIDNLVGAAS